MRLNTLFVTWFGSGLVPKAKGTAGTLAALPFAFVIQTQAGMIALCVATLLVFIAGCYASSAYMKNAGKHDPGEIVVDEVAGIWLVFCVMPLMWMDPKTELILWLYGASFIAFRFFDIVKPWPVSLIDRKVKGGFGVMVDDIAAALLACVSLGALGHLAGAMGWIEIHVR